MMLGYTCIQMRGPELIKTTCLLLQSIFAKWCIPDSQVPQEARQLSLPLWTWMIASNWALAIHWFLSLCTIPTWSFQLSTQKLPQLRRSSVGNPYPYHGVSEKIWDLFLVRRNHQELGHCVTCLDNGMHHCKLRWLRATECWMVSTH